MSLIRKAYNKSRYKKAAIRYCDRIFRQFGPLQSDFTKKLFEEKLEEVKMIAQKLASVPVPSYPAGYCGCGLSCESPKYKEDCYFYGETRDMGAIIRFCTKDKIEWGHCPCEKCDRFLSNAEADKIIRSNTGETGRDLNRSLK